MLASDIVPAVPELSQVASLRSFALRARIQSP